MSFSAVAMSQPRSYSFSKSQTMPCQYTSRCQGIFTNIGLVLLQGGGYVLITHHLERNHDYLSLSLLALENQLLKPIAETDARVRAPKDKVHVG